MRDDLGGRGVCEAYLASPDCARGLASNFWKGCRANVWRTIRMGDDACGPRDTCGESTHATAVGITEGSAHGSRTATYKLLRRSQIVDSSAVHAELDTRKQRPDWRPWRDLGGGGGWGSQPGEPGAGQLEFARRVRISSKSSLPRVVVAHSRGIGGRLGDVLPTKTETASPKKLRGAVTYARSHNQLASMSKRRRYGAGLRRLRSRVSPRDDSRELLILRTLRDLHTTTLRDLRRLEGKSGASSRGNSSSNSVY